MCFLLVYYPNKAKGLNFRRLMEIILLRDKLHKFIKNFLNIHFPFFKYGNVFYISLQKTNFQKIVYTSKNFTLRENGLTFTFF